MVASWEDELPEASVAGAEIGLRVIRLQLNLAEDLKRILEPYDIGSGELDVLFCLMNSGEPYEMRPSEITKGCYVTTGATTGRINRLIRSGHVERAASTKDRREMRVRLTPSGLETSQHLRMQVATEALPSMVLAQMKDDESAEFMRLLRIFEQKAQDLQNRR